MRELEKFCEENNWKFIRHFETPMKEKQLEDYTDLELSDATNRYLNQFAPEGIYVHQVEAIRLFLDNQNTCLSTGTASGKSLPFYVAGIETLTKDPSSRVIAIYPIKALGVEQEERWKKALSQANLNVKVGRIDGQVKKSEILANALNKGNEHAK